MKRAALLLLLTAGAALAQGRHEHGGGNWPGGGRGPGGSRNSYADPSAVIAAEGAMARMAQDKGQWTAFVATAAPDAVMFEPGMVYAHEWLKDRPNPAASMQWQPYQVWSSCDGSLMVSHGAWQQGAGSGSFTTIWQRQPDGQYKWVLDQNRALPQPLPQPDMIAALIADCPDRPRRPANAPSHGRESKPKPEKVRHLPPLDPAHRSGKSEDGTLSWDVTVDTSGARSLTVSWKKDGADRTALASSVPAQPATAP